MVIAKVVGDALILSTHSCTIDTNPKPNLCPIQLIMKCSEYLKHDKKGIHFITFSLMPI